MKLLLYTLLLTITLSSCTQKENTESITNSSLSNAIIKLHNASYFKIECMNVNDQKRYQEIYAGAHELRNILINEYELINKDSLLLSYENKLRFLDSRLLDSYGDNFIIDVDIKYILENIKLNLKNLNKNDVLEQLMICNSMTISNMLTQFDDRSFIADSISIVNYIKNSDSILFYPVLFNKTVNSLFEIDSQRIGAPLSRLKLNMKEYENANSINVSIQSLNGTYRKVKIK